VRGHWDVIAFNLCGHGHFDMQAYSDFFAGRLEHSSVTSADLAASLAKVPQVR